MRQRGLFRPFSILAFSVVGLIALASCGSDPEPTPTPVPPTSTPVPISGSGIEGGHPDFDFSTMVSQGYWLSRDHFGPFVMASGMGIPFEPPMDMVQGAMQMVSQNAEDPAMVPQNMMPLQAVFASAVPRLVSDPRDFGAMDFEGLRIDPSTFDQTVTVRGQAQTMLKESQWAHNFGSGHFGTPDGDFGAQQRFTGMMVSLLAQVQGRYAMQELMGTDGLFHDSDGSLDYAGNWVMLHALSDIAGLTGPEGGRYSNPDVHPMFDGAATQLFRTLEDRQPASAQEAAAAIRALAYRASSTEDTGVHDDVIAKARGIADSKLVGLTTADVVQLGAAIAGLIAAAEMSGEKSYRDAADGLYQQLAGDFDKVHGVFESMSVYNVDDIAWIIGGLNFMAQQGNDASKFPAKDLLLAFYESSVALSGLQLSAPPGERRGHGWCVGEGAS